MYYERNSYYLSFFSSLLGHCLLFIVILGASTSRPSNLGDPIIYSVSIEGGKSLGGISQVPKDDKPAQMAPPKNVRQAEASAPQPVVKPEDAEVSLADEKAIKEKEKEKQKQEELKKTAELDKKKAEEKKKKEEEARKKKQGEGGKQLTEAEIDRRLQAAMQRYSGESTDAGGQGFGAGALGGAGMGGGVQRPLAFFQYRDILKNHIKSGWNWYDTKATLICVVEFEIQPDGMLTDVNVKESSGNSEFDNSAMRAVLKSSPVPIPPAEVYEAFFKVVTMRFDPRE